MKIDQNADGTVTIVLEGFYEMNVMLNEGFGPVLKRARKLEAMKDALGLPMCGQPDCPDCMAHKTTLSMGESITQLADIVLKDAINEGKLPDDVATFRNTEEK